MAGVVALAPFFQVAGAVVGAIGAIQQGNAAADASRYNAAVAERNATVARQQAAANAEKRGREARKVIGAARAGYAANGLALEGSPLDVLESSVMNAELDRQTTLYAGELKAMGYDSSAALDRVSGSSGRTQGYVRASAILTGGAGTAMSLYNNRPATAGYQLGDYNNYTANLA